MIKRYAIGVTLFLGVFCIGAVFAAQPNFKKVMIVVFENTTYNDTMAQPFFAKLVQEGALLDNFYGVTNPSQPNYIAMIAGDTLGVLGNGAQSLKATHIGDLLEHQKRSWKIYAEGYPGNCFLGETAGNYVRKHVPFLSFESVQNSPARCQRVVDASALAVDIKGGALPDYSLYIPNQLNNGHDTGVAAADQWLATAFAPLMRDRHFMQDMLLVVTFDEGSWLNNHIYTVFYGDSVKPGSISHGSYNHYNLLRTIEDEFGLGTLGRKDATAEPISGIWK